MSDKLPHVEVHESVCKSIGDMAKENESLKGRVKRLEDAGDALKAAGYFGGFNDAVDKWIKVKEAKP